MRHKPLVFLGIALVQLSLPAWMILSHERVLREGDAFKFRTAPIDPRDPFRGEYVLLEFDAENGQWPVASPDGVATGEHRAYALLETDSAGFARVASLVPVPPTAGPFLRVEYYNWDNDTVMRIGLPFDRFYMAEGDGGRTERMLMPRWDAETSEEPLPAYALVRVLNGRAVIEDLIVGERPIREWLKELPQESRSGSGTVTAVPESPAADPDSLAAAPPPDEAP